LKIGNRHGFVPACIMVLAEHICHLIVTGKITGSDLAAKPYPYHSFPCDDISNILWERSNFTRSTDKSISFE
jgi:uracil permease